MPDVPTGSTTLGRERADVGSLEDIQTAARRTTGLDDFGDPSYEEGFRIVVGDLNSADAGLTGTGNYFMRSEVKSALVARLLTEARFKEHPELEDVEIERPIFVMGLPRTGTTALSRLLCADPDHQGLEMWLTQFPQPRPPRETWDDDPIFTAMQQAFRQHHVSNPEFMGIHYSDAAEPEECWRILRQSGKSIGFESLAHVPAYSAWLAAQDWTDAYARHKQNLQLIGLNDQDKRWVLKNPSHLIALDALMATYPDALVVMTHRDPVVSVASACSLSAEATAGHSTTFVGSTLGHDQLGLLAREWEAFWTARPSYDARQFFDVDYDAFVKDPVGTVGAIYESFGLTWTQAAQDAVRALDEESRNGPRRPAHRYSLEDYGLTEDQVRAAFSDPPVRDA